MPLVVATDYCRAAEADDGVAPDPKTDTLGRMSPSITSIT